MRIRAAAARAGDHDVVLEVQNLVHVYPGGRRALRGVDLIVRRGERVAILGANGSGKTTLVNHFDGTLLAQTGMVAVAGVPVIAARVASIRTFVAVAAQDPTDHRVRVTVRDVAQETSPDVSAGERRRAEIASVFAAEPELVVLDDPFTTLDARARASLVEEVLAFGGTVVVATGDPADARRLSDRCVVLAEGVVVADSSTRMLLGAVGGVRLRRWSARRRGLGRTQARGTSDPAPGRKGPSRDDTIDEASGADYTGFFW